MSSGFVPGGTIDKPIERDEEWKRAQEELEAERRAKAEIGKQNEGKSLYEVLQQNKAEKQDAFEESIRLRNQFRSLNEDEIDFLDTVLESTRAKEKAVKEETAAQLESFRQKQDEAQASLSTELSSSVDDVNGPDSQGAEETSWATGGRKRKFGKDRERVKGVKVRRSSTQRSGIEDPPTPPGDSRDDPIYQLPTSSATASLEQGLKPTASSVKSTNEAVNNPAATSTGSSKGLGLVAYDSDSDG